MKNYTSNYKHIENLSLYTNIHVSYLTILHAKPATQAYILTALREDILQAMCHILL